MSELSRTIFGYEDPQGLVGITGAELKRLKDRIQKLEAVLEAAERATQEFRGVDSWIHEHDAYNDLLKAIKAAREEK